MCILYILCVLFIMKNMKKKDESILFIKFGFYGFFFNFDF
jgi:hypothetical protein